MSGGSTEPVRMPQRVSGEVLLNSNPWKRFMDFCSMIGYGEIHNLKIQDGVPMVAETVTKKVKFT